MFYFVSFYAQEKMFLQEYLFLSEHESLHTTGHAKMWLITMPFSHAQRLNTNVANIIKIIGVTNEAQAAVQFIPCVYKSMHPLSPAQPKHTKSEPDTRKHSQPNANQVDFGSEWSDNINREIDPGKQVER